MIDKNHGSRKSVRFLNLMQSILGAALGVQSSRRLEEDFNSSSPLPYIVGGLLFTASFVGVLLPVVHLVLDGV